MPDRDPWSAQFSSVGEFIRRQRNLANLSIRELADLASVSNAYLSQIERGLHEPSVRVLTSVAKALNVSAETLLAQAGVLEASRGGEPAPTRAGEAEAAILADPALTDAQKAALLSVYRSYRAEGAPERAAERAAKSAPGAATHRRAPASKRSPKEQKEKP
jgi:transcriptional regulator with XRE-family HTH domain